MKTTMQKMMVMVIMAVLPALYGAAQVAAVDYKNTYSGSMAGYQSATVGIQTTTATAPSASFQSTSAMPYATGAESTLNADGTVNEEAYGVGRRNGPAKVNNNPNPGVDPNDPGNTPEPLGDAMLPLMLLACAFAFGKWFAKTKPLR